MSEPAQPSAPPDLDAGAGESEEVDALVVLAGQPHVLGQRADAGTLPGEWRSGALPAMQAAAVAAGGFVAGAAVVGLMHHRQRRSAALTKGRRSARELGRRGSGRGGKTGELAQIVGSRSFLVDVHLLGGPGGSR